MKRKTKGKTLIALDRAIHNMSDTALRAAVCVLSGDDDALGDRETPVLDFAFSALRSIMPTIESSAIQSIVQRLVFEEVVHRWARSFDSDMMTARRKRLKAWKPKALAKQRALTDREMFERERDRILKRPRRKAKPKTGWPRGRHPED